MKLQPPKFKKGQLVIVDNLWKSKIKDIGLFQLNSGKKVWKVQLESGFFAGRWAEENRTKLILKKCLKLEKSFLKLN